MSWIILILAGLMEVAGVTGMSLIGQGKKISGWLTLLIGFPISLALLSMAMETIPLGVSYAVWTGIGTVGSTLIGIIFYKESASYKRIMYLSMIIIAVIGLRLVTG